MRPPDYKYGDTYKYKGLKIYSSSEWMAHSSKKYRRVFDKAELSYIRVEFSFYNKLFDEEDWDAKVNIKTFKTKKGSRKEIFDQEEQLKISKDDNVVFVYKSWGVDTLGEFWEKGDYICEAQIDGRVIGSQKFYIEDIGLVTSKSNPYFEVESLKLFTGSSDAWKKEDRTYLTIFDKDETQYVWVELKIRNKTKLDWNFEYFINFYDDAGQFKAQIETLKYIDKDKQDKIYTFDRGWGNNEPGSWKDDKYTVELVFMDHLVAAISFETGNENIEGSQEITSQPHILSTKVNKELEDKKTLEEVLSDLDSLIGLEQIKRKIRDHISYLDFLKLRKEKGFEDTEQILLHSVFTGNPGTGKTTVVKLLGKIYNKMGLLSKGHVHEVDRADLVGEYIGQTAPKAKEAIEEARGGILFIDEAYMLARAKDDPKDFGKEVIEVIIKEMSDGPGDLAIMAAGYPKEMEQFVKFNPGLKSRIKYYFHFDDYFPEELMDIAIYAVKKRSVKLTNESHEEVRKMLVDAYRNRDRSFGNARYSYSLIDEGKMNLGLRLMKHPDVRNLSNIQLSTIEREDILRIKEEKFKKSVDIEIDEHLLRESMQDLNALIGLNRVKNDINELVKLVRYYRETGKNVLNKFSLHTVFTGNPGTGKTTLARIIGKIYKALGLLEKGHIVEAGRETLVAGYIGQTALKTKEKIDEAMGGVLFIDEAYALSDGGQNSYGREAIEVILKHMEDKRGKIAVIVAGYPDNMENFLNSNPGLKSRFDRTLHFKDYTPETLYKIASYMLSLENLTPSSKAEKFLVEHLHELYKKRDKYFGNARTVRKIIEKVVKNQNLRMASTPSEKRTERVMKIVTNEDVKNISSKETPRSASIGFK